MKHQYIFSKQLGIADDLKKKLKKLGATNIIQEYEGASHKQGGINIDKNYQPVKKSNTNAIANVESGEVRARRTALQDPIKQATADYYFNDAMATNEAYKQLQGITKMFKNGGKLPSYAVGGIVPMAMLNNLSSAITASQTPLTAMSAANMFNASDNALMAGVDVNSNSALANTMSPTLPMNDVTALPFNGRMAAPTPGSSNFFTSFGRAFSRGLGTSNDFYAPAKAGFAAEVGSQLPAILRGAEQERFQFNPNLQRVNQLMNQSFDTSPLVNNIRASSEAQRMNLQNTRSSSVRNALNSNIYAQERQALNNLQVQEQQVNNQLDARQAQSLLTTGNFEAQERIRKQTIDSQNLAAYDALVNTLGKSMSNYGKFNQNVKTVNTMVQENLNLMSRMYRNFAPAGMTFEEYVKLIQEGKNPIEFKGASQTQQNYSKGLQ